jgi:hypothetical protein
MVVLRGHVERAMNAKLNPMTLGITAAALGLGLVAVYVWSRGISGAASDAGKAAVNLAGGVATGVVDGVSGAVGIPATSDTTTDPAVARWIIDNYGYFEASKWSGAPALLKGWWMDAGTGKAPDAGSTLAKYLATLPPVTASSSAIDDETARLLNRYPAPAGEAASYEPIGYAYGA